MCISLDLQSNTNLNHSVWCIAYKLDEVVSPFETVAVTRGHESLHPSASNNHTLVRR
jgi:hypothetical protein